MSIPMRPKVPELEAPQEQPEAPTAATEQPGRRAQASLESPQEAAQPWSWWRRLFGD
jgi:hypothetical protein